MEPPRPAGLPNGLWALLAGMLAKDPDERPSTVAAAGALEDLEPRLKNLPARPASTADQPSVPDYAKGVRANKTGDTTIKSPTAKASQPEPASEPEEASAATRMGGRRQSLEPEPVASVTAPAAAEPWWRSRPKALVAGGATALVALVAVVALIVASSGGGGSSGAFSSPLRYTFESSNLANGVTLTRAWTIHPTGNGQLGGQVTIHNQNSSTWTGDATEVIPKSLANSVDNVQFTPQPDVVLQRDPAVLYHLANLAANGSQTFHYTIALQPGTATNKHLRQWVQDQRNTPIPTTTTTTATTTTTTTTTTRPATTPPTPNITACDAGQNQYSTASDLNIRTDTNTTAQQVGLAPLGACVTVFCKAPGEFIQGNNVWLKISYNGTTGYAADQYVNTGQGPGSAQDRLSFC